MSTELRQLQVIGIGAGDPDHLTLAAVKAMRRADAFFVLGKGSHAKASRPNATRACVPRRAAVASIMADSLVQAAKQQSPHCEPVGVR
ncbi:precorrin 6A synthase [Streptomyces sp. ADI97-07]|uniref:Precorrin-2 methylase n=1 Tax=Streptomyces clavifer TaxID=68188 RepID=A0ABS4VHS7_9ACTN|nr:hypothetical protein ASD51_31720 [Streptomyces sp. Root55]MBP2363471.1 precorrin-2 methylase [Streptomyces clavifer]RPK71776.1 precorrin 6A synthase [Streptomyces sp. ADI97-07]GHB28183.1 hypothetical protein GCM10010392_65450 [Streptomyces clavifer]